MLYFSWCPSRQTSKIKWNSFLEIKNKRKNLFIKKKLFTISARCSKKKENFFTKFIKNNIYDKYVSELFKIKTGVKQAGVFSGHLINFKMNDYYVQAELKNLGAKLNDVFIGCVGYCDDYKNISMYWYGLIKVTIFDVLFFF